MKPWAALFCAALCAVAPARAQGPDATIRVALGFGVDTTRSPEREIFALYRHYLAHRLDTISPHPDWSLSERRRWPVFDLVGNYVYQGFTNFTVVHLAPAVGFDSTYLLRTLVSAVDDSTDEVRPLALYRVYAVREDGRWVLANALPRTTRSWQRVRIDSVTFVYPPGRRFDGARAEATARFADSLARAFALPTPAIEYYFTDDLLETFRALGIEFFPLASDTVGGRANPADHQVFVGSSSAGENYRHEVAHVVLQPAIAQGHSAGLVVEGLMTWVGGSAGLGFRDLLPGLASYVAAHPELTLRGIMTDPPPRKGSLDVGYDGFAVLCSMIHGAGGVAGLREWLRSGTDPDSVLRSAATLLRVAPARLDSVWRRQVALPAGLPQWTDSVARRPDAQIYRTWLRYLQSKAP